MRMSVSGAVSLKPETIDPESLLSTKKKLARNATRCEYYADGTIDTVRVHRANV